MKRLFSGSSHSKPLRKHHLSEEISAETASQFIKALKFEKSEQGGSQECNLRYAAAAIQGFRPHMQDDYACTPSLSLKGEPFAYFGVYDGHGDHGGIVSQYCSDHLLKSILNRKAIRTAKHLTEELLVGSLRKTFIKFDHELLEETQRSKDDKIDFSYSGTTATMVLISAEQIYIGNVGDSRTILCREGEVAFSSKDHTPAVESEEERITAAGGKVHTTPAKHKIILDVNAYSNLAVSRTLGDYGFKIPPTLPVEKRVVSPEPDVTVFGRDLQRDQFLILASDGVFKSMSDEEVVEFVLGQMEVTADLSTICRNLIHTAYYAANNIPDDTTVVLIAFPAAPTLSETTVKEEEKIAVEAKEAIDAEIKDIVDKAESVWVVENEFNILQRLVKDLPSKYHVQLRVPYVMETLRRLRVERFPESSATSTSSPVSPQAMEQVNELEESVFERDDPAVVMTTNGANKTDRLLSVDEHKDLRQDIQDVSVESVDANSDQIESNGVKSESTGVNNNQVSELNGESESTCVSSDQVVSELTGDESTGVNNDLVTVSTDVNNDQVSTDVNNDQVSTDVNNDQVSTGVNTEDQQTDSSQPDTNTNAAQTD